MSSRDVDRRRRRGRSQHVDAELDARPTAFQRGEQIANASEHATESRHVALEHVTAEQLGYRSVSSLHRGFLEPNGSQNIHSDTAQILEPTGSRTFCTASPTQHADRQLALVEDIVRSLHESTERAQALSSDIAREAHELHDAHERWKMLAQEVRRDIAEIADLLRQPLPAYNSEQRA